jgi:hypothetical protein
MLRTIVRRWAATTSGVAILTATALVLPMASPAHAVGLEPAPLGVGVASGLVKGSAPTTSECTTGGAADGYLFLGVAIAGAFDGPGGVAAGKVSVSSPSGKATGDPLDGTPLGCGVGLLKLVGLWTTLKLAALLVSPVHPAPLFGCPTTGVASCGYGANASNGLADMGVVAATKLGTGAFLCPATLGVGTVQCSLSGGFVRLGTAVLVVLNGTAATNGATAQPVSAVVAAAIAPELVTAGPLRALWNAFAGPFVITGALVALVKVMGDPQAKEDECYFLTYPAALAAAHVLTDLNLDALNKLNPLSCDPAGTL